MRKEAYLISNYAAAAHKKKTLIIITKKKNKVQKTKDLLNSCQR